MLAANLETSTVIGGSSSVIGLMEHLGVCCKDSTRTPFTHVEELTHLDCTVRIYGQTPFGESQRLPKELSLRDIAEELQLLGKTQARYPLGQKQGTAEGWTIHKGTDGEGNTLIAAYASWIPRPL